MCCIWAGVCVFESVLDFLLARLPYRSYLLKREHPGSDGYERMGSFFILMFISERETECQQGRGRERGRPRIRSRLRAPSCQHRARCGTQTHTPRDHDLSASLMLNRLSHPGSPRNPWFPRACSRLPCAYARPVGHPGYVGACPGPSWLPCLVQFPVKSPGQFINPRGPQPPHACRLD